MPIVVDNNFKRDTYGIRAERLNAIQGNLASFQPVINAQPPIVTWSTDCYDVFTQMVAVAGVEMNESEGASLNVQMKSEIMEEEYQNAKILANSIYRDEPVRLKEFGFDSAFPDHRNDKIARVKKVLETAERHDANSIPTLLPATIITRLTNAKLAYEAALQVQDKERSDAKYAVSELSKQFEKDTKILQDLRSWTYAMIGKQDPRMGLIGMVNPGTGGNSGPVPAAPTNLSVDIATMVFSWDPILEGDVSSYILQSSIAGIEWQTIYSGTDNFVTYVPPEAGLKMYRALGRNQNGIGVASSVIYYNYQGLAAPDYVSASIVDPITGEVALNWGEVSEATEYKLYVSSVAVGAVAGQYVLVGQYAVATHTGIFALAQRHYFYVQAATIDKVSLPCDSVYVEL